MSELKGKVGDLELRWLTVPRGPRGTASVQVGDGEPLAVSWSRDEDGIWIELPDGVFGFDVRGTRDDGGGISYRLVERGTRRVWDGLAFFRAGEEQVRGGGGGKSGKAKIKAEMPGKIVRVGVKAGDRVSKGQALLVMEAMKMENEIVAPADGVVESVSVTQGQSVESGAVLALLVAEGSK